VLRVVRTAAARNQILFVERERFAHGERAAFVHGLAGLSPGERASSVQGLPIRKDVRRACGFEIISEGDFLDPLGTALGDPHGPCACRHVAPVTQMNAGREPDVVGLLAHRELAAGGRGFEARGARLGPGVRSVSPIAE